MKRLLNWLKEAFSRLNKRVGEASICAFGISGTVLRFTSNLVRTGFRMDPTPKMLNKEYISVSIKMTGPIYRSVVDLSARAYAMAPRSPESHIMNCTLRGILVFRRLQLTSEVVMMMFRKRAKFRFRIVVIAKPQPIFS